MFSVLLQRQRLASLGFIRSVSWGVTRKAKYRQLSEVKHFKDDSAENGRLYHCQQKQGDV